MVTKCDAYTFPSAQTMESFFKETSLLRGEDVEKISVVLTTAFANQTKSRTEILSRFTTMVRNQELAFPECNVEKMLMLKNLFAALAATAVSPATSSH
jgi:hypothetical protein